MIDTQDVVMVGGVNNEHGPIPGMIASAYNAISVGVTSGRNSDGLTTVDGEGRCKPNIVAPTNLTRWGVGLVAGVAAALLEEADRQAEEDEANEDAARSEVIRAVMYAGAFRHARWEPPAGEPLDRRLGAGTLDFDRSLVILRGGHVEPDTQTNQRYGWSFAQVQAEAQHTYRFTVDTAQGVTGFALVWNRRVQGGTTRQQNPDTGQPVAVWNNGAYSPNLDLTLVRLQDGEEEVIAQSASEVDNLELIHLRTLAPGEYELRINRTEDRANAPWDYALAWRIEAR